MLSAGGIGELPDHRTVEQLRGQLSSERCQGIWDHDDRCGRNAFRRIAAIGLTRHPGAFEPRTEWSRDVLQANAVKLYGKGMTMREVVARLGVSSSTISAVLHAAKGPVRPGGGTRPEAQGEPRDQ